MTDYDFRRLELWREHIADFVLIDSPRGADDTGLLDWVSPYLIYNVRKKCGYPLEDARKHRALVEEMIDAGVKTFTWKEGFKILYPKIFADLSERGVFEKFWKANYPYEVDE